MKLISASIRGFRGFASEQFFDLDADAVVVVGANGNGKTSLFDSILWCLTGRVPRLGSHDQQIVSKYSESGQAQVSIRLRKDNGGDPVTVRRITDGIDTKVTVETADGTVQGPEAEGLLIEELWPDAAAAAKPMDSLAALFSRCVYLQQDTLREFVESTTQQDKFAAISELVGAGRVVDLQHGLEAEKTAWTRATNARNSELEPDRDKLKAMERLLADISEREAPGDLKIEEWNDWWQEFGHLGGTVASVPPGTREATSAVHEALLQLSAFTRTSERKTERATLLLDDLMALRDDSVVVQVDLGEELSRRQGRIKELSELVRRERERVEQHRREQAESRETAEQLRVLATVALNHLGDRCPVCTQAYDVEATRRRLENMANTAASEARQELPAPLLELQSQLASAELECSALELEMKSHERLVKEHQAQRVQLRERLREFELDEVSLEECFPMMELKLANERSRQTKLDSLQKVGESLSLRISDATERGSIDELQREIETLRKRLQLETDTLHQRAETGDTAQRVIEALREAASGVVTERLREIEPLLLDIYSRIDVHPTFQLVRFLTSVVRGKGHLATAIEDEERRVRSELPEKILSSSQVNALAVCVFLSLNVGASRLPLRCALLDDPLQSLDDIHLLGLVELLRRLKDERQLCVSTHDARFGKLLARKLRPPSTRHRTIVIELEGWGRSGPQVVTNEVEADPAPLRLLAS